MGSSLHLGPLGSCLYRTKLGDLKMDPNLATTHVNVWLRPGGPHPPAPLYDIPSITAWALSLRVEWFLPVVVHVIIPPAPCTTAAWRFMGSFK